ncbi:MAG: hypothetical protein NTZ67_01480 [Gammaproteobacteria bacterium]|nr:hypothetical protein [Gammaproteobacteria bacterium]
MKFLDKTKTPEVEVELTLTEVQTLIKTETGRELVFQSLSLVRRNEANLMMVRFPAPVGFAIAANCDIPRGTTLFYYGGEYISCRKNLRDPKSAYILNADGTGETFFDADISGDFGALLPHLPDDDFLKLVNLTEGRETIQTANVKIISLQNECDLNELGFETTRAISQGELIGFSYGEGYWRKMRASPVLFHKSTLNTINLSTLAFDGVAVVHDEKKMGLTDINLFGCIGEYCQRLLLITQVLYKAIEMKDNDDPNWRRYADHLQKFNLTVTLNPDNTGKEIVLLNPTVGFFVTLSKETCLNVIEGTLIRKEASNRLTQLFNFFPVQQVKYLGCEAPPGSTFENGQTVLPKK